MGGAARAPRPVQTGVPAGEGPAVVSTRGHGVPGVGWEPAVPWWPTHGVRAPAPSAAEQSRAKGSRAGEWGPSPFSGALTAPLFPGPFPAAWARRPQGTPGWRSPAVSEQTQTGPEGCGRGSERGWERGPDPCFALQGHRGRWQRRRERQQMTAPSQSPRGPLTRVLSRDTCWGAPKRWGWKGPGPGTLGRQRHQEGAPPGPGRRALLADLRERPLEMSPSNCSRGMGDLKSPPLRKMREQTSSVVLSIKCPVL